MERAFSIIAVLLLIASAVALWHGKTDATFVLAALGALAWFVGFRIRLGRTNSDLKATETGGDDSEDIDED